MQKIHACLWFDTQAEEAVNFYCSLFKNSKIHPEISGRFAIQRSLFKISSEKILALIHNVKHSILESLNYVLLQFIQQ